MARGTRRRPAGTRRVSRPWDRRSAHQASSGRPHGGLRRERQAGPADRRCCITQLSSRSGEGCGYGCLWARGTPAAPGIRLAREHEVLPPSAVVRRSLRVLPDRGERHDAHAWHARRGEQPFACGGEQRGPPVPTGDDVGTLAVPQPGQQQRGNGEGGAVCTGCRARWSRTRRCWKRCTAGPRGARPLSTDGAMPRGAKVLAARARRSPRQPAHPLPRPGWRGGYRPARRAPRRPGRSRQTPRKPGSP
jgi:hypothetical protein